MSTSVIITFFLAMNCFISGSCHALEPFGCSCMKCLPCCSCISYNFKQKRMCRRPASNSFLMTFGSRRFLFMFWICENGVQGGDPTTQNG